MNMFNVGTKILREVQVNMFNVGTNKYSSQLGSINFVDHEIIQFINIFSLAS